MSALCFPIILN